jgi:cation:H+ antiporter
MVLGTENLIINSIIGILGVIVLVFSADKVVEHAIKIAKHFGLSNTFIGMSVLSFGTSLPEITSHVIASFGILSGRLNYKVASATVLGANIGSDVIQQTLILGLVVFIMGTLVFNRKFLLRNYLPMIGTTLMCIILGWDRTYSRIDGAILFGTFIVYMWFLYEKDEEETASKKKMNKKAAITDDVFLVVLGMAAMAFSAYFVLSVVELIVAETGVGGSLIGVVTLGVASALPEFLTAISGIRKKAAGISLGTLIGSNITNPLVAIGLGALISGYWVPGPLVLWDLPMETISAALLLIFLWFRKGKLGRWGGVYLIGLYVVYLLVRTLLFAVD